MTTLAYSGTFTPCLGKMLDATPPVVWHCPVGAAGGFLMGDFVVRTTGLVVVCATTVATQILGIAKEDAPSAAGEVAVLVLTGMTAFKIPVHHETVGRADIEEADHGNATYDLVLLSSPYWHIDKEESGATVTVQQFVDPVGTVNGIVLATINYGTREVG